MRERERERDRVIEIERRGRKGKEERFAFPVDAPFYTSGHVLRMKKGKLGANATKRVAAGAHLPTYWLFEPAKRPDDKADYCLGTRR